MRFQSGRIRKLQNLALEWVILGTMIFAGGLSAQVNANFVADATSGCAPLTVRFTDLSTGSPDAYLWDFGNGNTSVFDDVIATYTTPGTYTVTLTVTDTTSGQSSTRTETGYITVFADPLADFSVDVTSGCAPLTVNFSDASVAGDGNIVSWTWDFGDGNVQSGANPSHTYVSAGDYDVTLVVVDDNGCGDTYVINDLVSVTEVANVSFSASPQTGCNAPLTVNFTSSVSPAGTYTYLWDFGDGTTSTATNPTKVYAVNGDYDVSLTITDVNGCQEVVTEPNFILINNPTADFYALDTEICTGRPVQFINQSTGADSYTWTFGDGNTSNAENPSHSFSAPGTYSVSLTADNSAGCSDIIGRTAYITVHPSPAPGFTVDRNSGCQAPMLVSFTDQSIGNIIAWDWDFGNGNFSSGQNPTTTYSTAGLYDVSLTVTTDRGCTATETVPDYIQLANPDAEFASSATQGCAPLTVNFLDISTSPTDPIVSWVWNFGDGNVSNAQNPSHTYTTAGDYTVTFTVTTASGCQNTEVFQYVEVGTPPTTNFVANPLTVCANQPVNFQDLTTGTVDTWIWFFGDGGTSNAQNPTHTYAGAGLFTVTLITEYNGCRDTLIRPDYITVVGPYADFVPNPLEGCQVPLTVNLFDQSTNATGWYWTFGDGSFSTQQNPSKTYTSPGNYDIILTVTDSLTGCTDQATFPFQITNPTASFTANQVVGCVPFEVDFTNLSFQTNSYVWDFGDGTTTNVANPTHTYQNPGTYTVTLLARGGNCEDTLIRTNYITVIGPSLDFTADQLTGCAPLPVTFTSSASSGSGIVSWIWDFGDGSSANGASVAHTYSNPGSYDVTLTVIDGDGCTADLTKTSYINPTFPTASFVSDDTLSCPGALVRFRSTSTGNGLTYLWDFGDGTNSTAPNPTHLFPGNGTYNITLTVTDANGCSDSEIKFNYVDIGQPTAAFAADSTSATCPPLQVNFTDQSSADVVSYSWDFGDGSTSSLANPSKIYSVPGNYDVTLVVTNNVGCRDTLERPNLIQIQGPTGSFSFAPLQGCRPLNVTFNVNSPQAGWTYDWDFGDGTGGTGTSINHIYYTDTTITPIMLIEDAAGCVVSVTSPDRIIIHPLPQPSFTASQTEICLGQNVQFTNTSFSKRPVTSLLWDFGDGTTSTANNPSHTYLDTGTYVVNLQLSTVDGCTDTMAVPVEIRVNAPPTAIFDMSGASGCVPFPIAFSDSSTGAFPIVNWEWDFGDGDTDNGQVITPHMYDTAGVYMATLTVTDSRGCTGQAGRIITANGLPPVDFDAFRYGCAPISVDFTDRTVGSSPSVSWEWSFGDGTKSFQQNPTHTYSSDGQYTVSLKITDANGCVNTLTRTNYIQLEHPIANFTSDATVTCPPQLVTFNNLSIPDTTSSYLWDFGDGTPASTFTNPLHTYYGSDTFDVSLIITNIFGCADTLVRPQHVINYPRPTASYSVSDTSVCVPANLIFTNSSIPSGAALTGYRWDFGTGSGVTTPNASFNYTTAGTYTTSLEITDANGCKDTAYEQVYIQPLPVADFIADDTVGCAVTSISFTDLTTGTNAPVLWEWDFGDGGSSTARNPSNTYFSDGTYTVTLKVEDINGCRDSITRTNYIELDHPDADFTVGAVQACPGTAVSFTDISNGPFPITTWRWDFGDGSPRSFAQNPSHTYTTPGTYTVTLIVSDGISCQDTMIKTSVIEVFTPPTAGFTYTPTSGCDPLTVSFSDASVNGTVPVVGYDWDFGDGSGAVTANPTYTYNTPGVYDVTLIVTDANGCEDTLVQQVEVLEVPVTDFIADKVRGCGPTTIDFTDLTTTPYTKVQWAWDFGDGNTSNSPAPSHTYLNDGIYTVKLVVTDQNGCQDSMTKVNYIRLSHPVASFSMSQNVVCPNDPIGVTFTDLSIADTTLVSWLWDFGDGNTSTSQNPTHIYTTSGTYLISLTIENVLGCGDDTTITQTLEVLNPPVPAFSISDSANCTPLSIVFTDNSTDGDAAIVDWSWDFGDSNTSLQQNPSHTWTTPGVYTVTLTTTDANGCVAQATKQVRAYELPVAEFMTVDSLGCAAQTVTFQNQSASTFSMNYRKWFFGDGDSAVGPQNPTHTYAADGVYDVTLIVGDINGCRDTLERPQYIRLSHPVANFTLDQNEVCPGSPVGVTFTDTSIPDTTIVGWLWRFGDGGTSTQQNPSHSYIAPGTYTVILTVTNILGCSDTDTLITPITVSTPPTAAFSINDSADCAPFAVSLTDLSTDGDYPIVVWRWDFGNGDTSLQQNPSYVYSTSGVETITLTTIDQRGCSDEHSIDVEAYELPVVDFAANDSLGCSGQVFQFTDLSTASANITSWLWDFGDSNTSTLKNPSHTYASEGFYTVTLTVVDVNGCTETLTRNNYIRLTRPIAAFTQNRTTACPGVNIRFTDLSTPDHPIVDWQWEFGDGGTSTDQNPTHYYSTPGFYDVTLIVTNVQGCTDTLVKPNLIHILTPPTAAITPLDISGCPGFTADFKDVSTAGDGTLVNWTWDFGNGKYGTGTDPAPVTYANPGTYAVQMIVVDDMGCRDTATTTATALNPPSVDFVADRRVSCAPATINFTDLTTGDGVAVAWTWDFGDGNTSNAQDPSHTYSANGVYDIILTVTDDRGCTSTLTKTQYIRLNPPTVNFTAGPRTGCPGFTASFVDQSFGDTTITAWLWSFGDGTTSNQQAPTHTYNIPGEYDVTLIVWDAVGCSDTLVKADFIDVYTPPTAVMDLESSTGCAPFLLEFDNNSVGNDTTLATHYWDFGFSNNNSASASGTFLYPSHGNYTLTYVVSDENGCQDTTTEDIEVFRGPNANFVAFNTNGCTGVTVEFRSLANGPAPIIGYFWNFGDGNTSTQEDPVHVYTTDGYFDVTQVVIDANGCTDTLIKRSLIKKDGPNADFTMDVDEGCAPLTVNFEDLSDGNGRRIQDWTWSFGDGTTSFQEDPVKTFTTPGTYIVQLTVSIANGCSGTHRDTVVVFAPPVADIGPDPAEICEPGAITLLDQSVIGDAPLVSWTWAFGDGGSSLNQNPNHVYGNPGTYTAQLMVEDANGCTDLATHSVIVQPKPTANFSSSRRVGCAAETIQFTDQSIGSSSIVAWEWSFGDGNTSTQQNPIHTYLNDGNYDVQLIITDFSGCQDTLLRTQYIRLSHPVANFNTSATELCEGEQVAFNDLSIADTTLAGWFWDFGDGNTSTQQNPTHIYTAGNTYTVTLIVTNVLGCSDTIVRNNLIEVNTAPGAAFTASVTSGCAPLRVIFTNTTTVNSYPIVGWNWDFDNAQTATTQNAVRTFTNAGTYDVQLVATDAFGCTDTFVQRITVTASPIANFEASDSVGCAPELISFTDLSTGSIPVNSWEWDFGDGNSSTGQFPDNNYSSDGLYTVRLMIADANGCRDTLTKPQYIRLSHPVADFTVNQTEICPGTTVQFSDASTPDTTLVSWTWDFGDGYTGIGANPAHRYDTPGNYTVTLVVDNVLGCGDQEVKTALIHVIDPPQAAFAPVADTGCTPFLAQFVNNSQQGDFGITGYAWTFGDGNTSTNANPSNLYTAASTYNVVLIATDLRGCRDTATASVTSSTQPVADFDGGPRVGCAPLTVNFTDRSTGDYTIVSHEWDFGDGGTSTAQNPTYTYGSDGTYTVSLVITDANGCTDTLTRTNYIRMNSPVADFTVNQSQICPGTVVQFNDATIPDTTIVSWAWTFGDGGKATGPNPTHMYTDPGVYAVTLTITNALGCTDQVVKPTVIEVIDPPLASFTPVADTGCTPFLAVFNNNTQAGDLSISGYQWTFGDGNTSTNANPTNLYGNPGTYPVTLIAIDQQGCRDTFQTSVTSATIPVADFDGGPRVGCAPLTVNFTDRSSGDYSIVSHFWDFGDGVSSTAQNPSHTYTVNGTYTVTEIIIDANGCSDTLTRVNYIHVDAPVANFTVNQSQICPGTEVQFTDTSIPDTTIVSWVWDFGDSETGTGQNPSHFYSSAGTYTVTLTITNVLGCTDQVVKVTQVDVIDPPVASFTPVEDEGCTPFLGTFTNTSTAGDLSIASYEWDFGDGGSSNQANPSHLFTPAGTYTVTLIATDLQGCADTVQQDVTATTIPIAEFEGDPRFGCAPEQVNFVDLSMGDYAIAAHKWYFGDGDSSSLQFPFHTYSQNGAYTVQLIVTDVKGCTDTMTKVNYVRLSEPVADFTVSDTDICPGTEVQFADASIADTTLTRWTWDFGDTGTGTGQNPTHVYTDPGTYTVTLTIRNVNGCESQVVKTALIRVSTPPEVQFVPSALSGCAPLTLTFNNQTVINTSPVVLWEWDYGNGQTATTEDGATTLVNPGTYTVRLIATDALGCSDTLTRNIEVFTLPVVNFVASDSFGCAPTDITFQDLTQTDYGLASWLWNFGDANGSTVPVPLHTYSDDGIYDVSLIVTDVNGCRDTLEKPQYINLSHPVADFSVSENEICPGTEVIFTDTSIPDTTLISWFWDFGDGSTGTGSVVNHLYTTPGTYTVSHIVTNVLGCADDTVKMAVIEVLTPPTPSFTMSDTAGCAPLVVQLNDRSTANSYPIGARHWDFGNGDTSNLRNAQAVYTVPGTYTITLTVTDLQGCESVTTGTVVVPTQPRANFFASDTIGCEENIEFYDLSQSDNTIVAWLWTFGDGDSSTQQNPVHTYANTGVYDVSLTVWDNYGCSHTRTRLQYINLTRPKAAFGQDIDIVCPGTDIQFLDESVPDHPLVSWQWYFGDGDSATGPNPIHAYDNAGVYTVTLVITNVFGCTDTETGQVEVLQPPTASFTPDITEGCQPLTINFTDASVPSTSPILAWFYDFGDGTIGMGPNATHTFNSGGIWPITLTILDVNGCSDDTVINIEVFPGPEVDFTADVRVGCAPQTVQFTDLTTSVNPIVSWFWDFGDGSTSTAQNPSHTYSLDGDYTVTLITIDANGCSDTLVRPMYIRLSHPVARFDQDPAESCPGLEVQFLDTSIPDTTIVSWLWDFGDGFTSTLSNPTHKYNNPGVYDVSLIVTNVLGCSDVIVKPGAVIIHTPPTAAFTPGDTTACVPFSLRFLNQSTFTDASIIAYQWNFGDGTTSSQPSPVHTFSTAGVYEVEMIAIDGNGCADTASHTITVRPLPTPAFTVSDSLGCAPVTVSFFDQSFASAAITDWYWEFGDGATSTDRFPTHTYLVNDDYDVSLTITDVFGCSQTITDPDVIRLGSPDADFVLSDNVVCPGTEVTFTNTSLADTTIDTYIWDFGDGFSGSGEQVTHAYVLSGTYDVTLIIQNVNGCTDTTVKTAVITVLQQPNADFLPDAMAGCAPFTVNFTNGSTPTSSPIASWSWDFDDGKGSIFTDPTNTFKDPGFYDVALVATDQQGCTDTARRVIQVYHLPVADFAATDQTGCSPISIGFLDQTQRGDANVIAWEWNFGDNTGSNVQFPNHSYSKDSTYNVSLSVIDANGCRDTVMKPQFIELTRPEAAFTLGTNQTCPGTMVSFLDQSIGDTTLSSWFWDFGDGNTSTDQNPLHMYTYGGVFDVTLTVTNARGCSHTVTLPSAIEVWGAPVTLYTPSAQQGCVPFTVSMTDNSTGTSAPVIAWDWDFGNGDSSSAQEPDYTFEVPGTYTVSLTTTDNNGCQTTFTRELRALALPHAEFLSVDTIGCAPHVADFVDLTTGPAPITGWFWNFGDGTTSPTQHPQHLYNKDGIFDVSLIAIDANGCRDTMMKPRYINLGAPIPDFDQSANQGCPGLVVDFTDQTYSDTTLVSWHWDFGDGNTSVQRNPTHTYDDPGEYTVTLTVSNAFGCSRSITRLEAVRISTPPVANFEPSDSVGCAPLRVTFADQTVAVSSPITNWNWTYGNGDGAIAQEPTYTFSQGTYEVQLLVVDALGCSDSIVKTVEAISSPVADFVSGDTVGCAPHDATFTSLSTADRPILTYNWTFGDGNAGLGPQPTHQYGTDGVYDVTLTVIDQVGCSDTITKPQYVRLTHPTADFVVDVNQGCENTVVQFRDTSVADTFLTGWFWNFGDGTTSVQKNPIKTYTEFGQYDVTLVVTNLLGCQDTIVKPNQVNIFEPPTARIEASDTSGCVPFQVDFSSFSTSPYGLNEWEWFVDGGSKGGSENFSFFFQQVGEYEVSLVVTDNNGCTDTITRIIYVRPVPVADFVASDTMGCAPDVFTFTDLTQHRPNQWYWDFGDGDTSNQQNPVHTYQQDGIYTVNLRIVDQYGCSDEIEKINYISLDHPEADLFVNYDPSCPPVEAFFTGTATGPVGMSKWHWNFGDGTTTTTLTNEVRYVYNTSDEFDVRLIVTDSLGCTDTVTKVDFVNVLGDVIPAEIEIQRVSVLSDTEVEIQWYPHPEEDFSSYTVYREDPVLGYVPIHTATYVNNTTYIDRGVDTRSQQLCYKVTATNQCGSESNLLASNEHCTVEASTDILPGAIIVNWQPYQGWDVEQYEVYRVNNYNPALAEFLAVVDGSVTQYEDPVETCFSDRDYRIRAIGAEREQESWSDSTSAISETGVRGEPTKIVRATVEDNQHVLIEWDDFTITGPALLQIERAQDDGPFGIVRTMPPGDLKYTDTDVNVEQASYAYRVSMKDSCGNVTPVSNIGKSILLNADNEGRAEVPTLTWTSYQDWEYGVLDYEIQVYNDTLGRWEMVNRVVGSDTTFIDESTFLNQSEYCYRIVAFENGGRQAISISNESCVRTESGFFVPNVFTPNGDGINDLISFEGYNLQTASIKVYSRWGLLVWESNNLTDKWDGYYNGQPLQEGVYSYVVQGVGYNGTVYNYGGYITLLR